MSHCGGTSRFTFHFVHVHLSRSYGEILSEAAQYSNIMPFLISLRAFLSGPFHIVQKRIFRCFLWIFWHRACFVCSQLVRTTSAVVPCPVHVCPLFVRKSGSDAARACPICGAPLTNEDLIVDGFIAEILARASANTTMVLVEPDGSWESLGMPVGDFLVFISLVLVFLCVEAVFFMSFPGIFSGCFSIPL